METFIANYPLKDSPTATAIVNRKLRIMEYSNLLLTEFSKTKTNINGSKLLDVLEDLPEEFLADMTIGLTGEKIFQPGFKIYLSNNQPKWIKWSIGPWKDNKSNIGGLILTLEDVTVAKRNEQLFAKGEEVSRTGSWEVDLFTNNVYWSPMTKKIHEVSMDYEPVLDEGINYYKEGESRDKITKAVNEAIENGTPWDLELILVTSKQREIWVRAKGDVEKREDKTIRLYGTFQDIDEKKKAELRYKEISERLKIATKTANIGVFEFDIIKNKLIWDENMFKLHGVEKTTKEITYDFWKSTVHADDIEEVTREFNLALQGEKEFDHVFRIICPNRTIKYVKGLLVVSKRNLQGEPLQVIGANWDITEIVETRQSLTKSQESFAATFINSAIGMALVDSSGKWLKVNHSLCNSLGYSEDELLKMTFQELTYPEDLESGLVLFNDAISGKRDSYQLEKRYVHKNGHLVHNILTVTTVRNAQGQVSYFIVQILDINSRKETEKKLEKLVEVTKVQNESLLNFAHIVSHNLRSHSTNIGMLAKFLTEEKDSVEQGNLIQMLVNASETLSETILHLNEVVRIRTDIEQKMQHISLMTILENVEKGIKALLIENTASIIKDVSPKHEILGIPAYLDSIFLNLYTNAIKYRNSEKSPIIKITSKELGDKLIVVFEDNGKGIDLERHGNKVFGMYKTFHGNKDAKGIGLFITKNQIESMGGSIELESKPNLGTTFVITLSKQ